MSADQSYALRKLIRSYALQIDYIKLLVKYGQLEPAAAQAEMDVIGEKMDCAAERVCQLRLAQQSHGRAIDPALIPDLQYV